jgi:hypothetical protein
MTDRDDSPDGPSGGFLERWSRKKIDADRTTALPADADAEDVSPSAETGLPERPAKIGAGHPSKAAPTPEFDLASLPSLDSITAATDIRAFLTPGVPAELTRAALRRAWAADPVIRDFKGLAENAWDFTDPAAMPGFGALPPGTDIKKLLAQIFGDEKPDAPDPVAEKPAAPPEIAKEIEAPAEPLRQASAEAPPVPSPSSMAEQLPRPDMVQRDNNIATHKSNSDDETQDHGTRRQHGGALPQ